MRMTEVNVFLRPIRGMWWRSVVRARYISSGLSAHERFPRMCNICGYEGYFGPESKALREIHRVLRPGGHALIMLPLIEGWERTYENPDFVKPAERSLHFGQADHMRFYGSDVRERIKGAGFELSEFTAEGADVAKYGLLPGEKLFVARCQRWRLGRE